MTTESLFSLQGLISKDARSLDEEGKRRLEKHVQKLANAAKVSFAERDIQKVQIRFLRKANDEAKVRRSTRSIVLGKAKVMRYEDLVNARMERAEKVQVAATKRRKIGKCRTQASEAAVAEQRAPVARMI